MLGFKCLFSLNPRTILQAGITGHCVEEKETRGRQFPYAINGDTNSWGSNTAASTVYIAPNTVEPAFLSEDIEHRSPSTRGWLLPLVSSSGGGWQDCTPLFWLKSVYALYICFLSRFPSSDSFNCFLSSLTLPPTLPLLSPSALLSFLSSQFLDNVSLCYSLGW